MLPSSKDAALEAQQVKCHGHPPRELRAENPRIWPGVDLSAAPASRALSARWCQRATILRTLWPVAHCGNGGKISVDGRRGAQGEDPRHQGLPDRGNPFRGYHYAPE